MIAQTEGGSVELHVCYKSVTACVTLKENVNSRDL